jgi:hypothetical protein
VKIDYKSIDDNNFTAGLLNLFDAIYNVEIKLINNNYILKMCSDCVGIAA